MLSRFPAPHRSAAFGIRGSFAWVTSPRGLSGCGALLALLVATTSLAQSTWQQDRFVIGAITGPTPTSSLKHLFDGYPPFIGTDTDTTQVGLCYRAAARAGLNLLLLSYGLESANPSWELKTAYALGLRVAIHPVVNGTAYPVLSCPAGVSPAEWTAFAGYNLHDGTVDHTFEVSQDEMDRIRALHSNDPTKLVHGHENYAPRVASWLAQPASDRPDVWSGQFYTGSRTGVWGQYENCWCSNEYCTWRYHCALEDRIPSLLGTAPYWSYAYVNGNEYGDNPDATSAHMRAMAFIPVLYGAKGIIWSLYEGITKHPFYVQGTSSADYPHVGGVRMGHFPSERYWDLRRVNQYLEKVIGPVVMSSDRLATMARDCWHTNDPDPVIPCESKYLPGAEDSLFHESSDIPAGMLVSVFKPRLEGDGYFYLIIFNTNLLAATSGTLRIRDPAGAFDVGAAPSVENYEGATGFAKIATTPASLGGEMTTSFAVSLGPAEARVFRVVPHALPGLVRLASPSGGASWVAGQSQTVTWEGIANVTSVRLYTDSPRPEAPSGPYVELPTPGETVTSYPIPVPPVSTNRGFVVVSGTDAEGHAVSAMNHAPIYVSTSPARVVAGNWVVADSVGCAFGALSAADAQNAALLYCGDHSFTARLWSPWQSTGPLVVPDHSLFGAGAVPGWFGVAPSLVTDPGGILHGSYFTLYYKSTGEASTQLLRYAKKSASGWSPLETVADVGMCYGNSAIAFDSDGEPLMAFNAGSADSYKLRLRKREPDPEHEGEFVWVDIAAPGGPTTRNASNIAIVVDANGVKWISLQPRGGRLWVWSDIYGPWEEMLNLPGITGASALHLGSDGVPEICYLVPGDNGGQAIHFQRLELEASGLLVPSELVESESQGVSGIAIQNDGTSACIAFTANGVLREAVRGAAGTWSKFDVVRNHDASGPVGFVITTNGYRWYSYWDRPGLKIRTAYVAPLGGGGQDGCEPDCDPPPILPAIELRSANPLSLQGGLAFELRFTRAGSLRLELFDVSGRRLAERAPERFSPGDHQLLWKPDHIAPGLYFIRATVDDQVLFSRRVAMLR